MYYKDYVELKHAIIECMNDNSFNYENDIRLARIIDNLLMRYRADKILSIYELIKDTYI